jgi:hypothetical protein
MAEGARNTVVVLLSSLAARSNFANLRFLTLHHVLRKRRVSAALVGSPDRNDMITINFSPNTHDGDALAAKANAGPGKLQESPRHGAPD